MVSSSLLMIWGLGAIVTASVATLVFWKPLATILHEALPEKVARAFSLVFAVGIFVIALHSGVGPGARSGYDSRALDSSINFVAEVYSSVYFSSIALFSYFSVLFFVLLVCHVGLTRARIDAGRA